MTEVSENQSVNIDEHSVLEKVQPERHPWQFQPNARTLAVMERTDRGEGLTKYESSAEFFKALGI
ncbi:hypothetical protein YA0089_18835 [Pseudomonas viridiflava]|uniref:hypothetical protein n=1 Tax=Pseudomonas viridiflava TaxID=33069 RepID=UPI0018E5E79D|nr:hypothetical protein [Pseudomonas viridiflava]MBI6725664.1 hypothetical protein [Pseudomonas viridiflava]